MRPFALAPHFLDASSAPIRCIPSAYRSLSRRESPRQATVALRCWPWSDGSLAPEHERPRVAGPRTASGHWALGSLLAASTMRSANLQTRNRPSRRSTKGERTERAGCCAPKRTLKAEQGLRAVGPWRSFFLLSANPAIMEGSPPSGVGTLGRRRSRSWGGGVALCRLLGSTLPS